MAGLSAFELFWDNASTNWSDAGLLGNESDGEVIGIPDVYLAIADGLEF
jgi:hypothetical protein